MQLQQKNDQRPVLFIEPTTEWHKIKTINFFVQGHTFMSADSVHAGVEKEV